MSSPPIDITKLLQGRYEAERLPADLSRERIVPDFAFNVLHEHGLLYVPIADQVHLAKGGERPRWPEGRPFAACLTHDVDSLTMFSSREAWRRGARNARLRSGALGRALAYAGGVRGALAAAARRGRDPLHRFEEWLQLEESVGAKSTMFFLPEDSAAPHSSDQDYRYADTMVFEGRRTTIGELMRELDRRGWEIGLHPRWYSFDDAAEMRAQKEQIERVLGHEIASVRQHFLHFDIRDTPRVQSDAGFRYDSTLGFNDNVGFRMGTSYPFHVYDLRAESPLPLLEIPLTLQDGALLSARKGLRLDENTAYRYVVKIIDATAEVGGVANLLWHPHVIATEAWWRVYTRALRYLHEKGAWFGTVRDVGAWWEKHAVERRF